MFKLLTCGYCSETLNKCECKFKKNKIEKNIVSKTLKEMENGNKKLISKIKLHNGRNKIN